MKFAYCGAAALGLLLSGCATVTRGTSQNVTILSEPPGAQAKLSNGMSCPSTPCTLKISRKQGFTVAYSKDGYKPHEETVVSKISGAGEAGLMGNVLIGGVIGGAVDSSSGAMNDLSPNPVKATLEPIAPPAAPASEAPKGQNP